MSNELEIPVGDEQLAGVTPAHITERLEYLRGRLRAESISMDELIELQELGEYIEPGDVELEGPAGLSEQSATYGVRVDMIVRVEARSQRLAERIVGRLTAKLAESDDVLKHETLFLEATEL